MTTDEEKRLRRQVEATLQRLNELERKVGESETLRSRSDAQVPLKVTFGGFHNSRGRELAGSHGEARNGVAPDDDANAPRQTPTAPLIVERIHPADWGESFASCWSLSVIACLVGPWLASVPYFMMHKHWIAAAVALSLTVLVALLVLFRICRERRFRLRVVAESDAIWLLNGDSVIFRAPMSELVWFPGEVRHTRLPETSHYLQYNLRHPCVILAWTKAKGAPLPTEKQRRSVHFWLSTFGGYAKIPVGLDADSYSTWIEFLKSRGVTQAGYQPY